MMQNSNALINECVDLEIVRLLLECGEMGIFCFLQSGRRLSSSQSKINDGGCGQRGCDQAEQLLTFLI